MAKVLLRCDGSLARFGSQHCLGRHGHDDALVAGEGGQPAIRYGKDDVNGLWCGYGWGGE